MLVLLVMGDDTQRRTIITVDIGSLDGPVVLSAIEKATGIPKTEQLLSTGVIRTVLPGLTGVLRHRGPANGLQVLEPIGSTRH